jgi:putative transposase
MARLARIVAEGMPHHIVQRGNRRQQVFFSDADKQEYLKLLKESAEKHKVNVWSYCLMDNHVHLIVVPNHTKDLASCMGWVHKQYTRMINFREGWRGYLWQGRFSSFVLDERHLYAAVRYVERNPVRAKLVRSAHDYPFSSARARVKGYRDDLLSDFYLIEQIKDWEGYLSGTDIDGDLKLLRRHGATGRPLGSKEFLEKLAKKLGIEVEPKKPGPKSKLNN